MRARPLVLVFLLIAATAVAAAAQGPPPRTRYDSRCGSEIPWLTDHAEATRVAKETGRPVLWFVPTSFGTRMDRKQELYWAMRGGPFMDEELIRFVRSRFVALELGLDALLDADAGALAGRDERAALAQTFDLKHMRFIEPGFVLLDSGMRPVWRIDGLGTLHAGWLLERLRAAVAEHEALQGPVADEPAPAPRPAFDAARAALAAGRFAEAAEAYAALEEAEGAAAAERAEAGYLRGAALHRAGRSKDGDAAWQRVARKLGEERHGWKARLELDRMGPFVPGLEILRDPPASTRDLAPIRGSQVGSSALADADIARDALPVLLALQRQHGGWDDSRYDFGGADSLPNVHVAVSALAAAALHAWRDLAPEAVDAALDRALPWIFDEKNVATRDEDELIWALVYRLELLARLIPDAAGDKKRDRELRGHARRIVQAVTGMQAGDGSWRHEYAAAFTTASVVHALDAVGRAGIEVPREAIEKAATAIEKTRGADGTFAYGLRGQGADPRASAGRMPICELALHLAGRSKPLRTDAAIDMAFEHHDVLEAVRRYDDHADRFGNGGFFFWYDVHGLALAVAETPMSEASRTERRAALRGIVARTRELDGGWMDSHELGKTYGTAMGLLVLRTCGTAAGDR